MKAELSMKDTREESALQVAAKCYHVNFTYKVENFKFEAEVPMGKQLFVLWESTGIQRMSDINTCAGFQVQNCEDYWKNS